MSVTAFELGSAVVEADAFAGVAASAVPSTIATITLREDRFEGKYRVMRSRPKDLVRSSPHYTDSEDTLSRSAEGKNLEVE
jgi:hypothetical protein